MLFCYTDNRTCHPSRMDCARDLRGMGLIGQRKGCKGLTLLLLIAVLWSVGLQQNLNLGDGHVARRHSPSESSTRTSASLLFERPTTYSPPAGE